MTSDHIPSLHLSFFSYFSLVTLVSFFSPTHLAGFQKADLFQFIILSLWRLLSGYFRVIIFMKYHIIRTIKCISTAFRVQFYLKKKKKKVSKCFPHSFSFFGLTVRLRRYQFPDQGSHQFPLQWKQSPNHQTIREFPCYF